MQFLKLFLLLAIFSNFLFSTEPKKITLQLAWKNQFQFAGYYMAKEKGFYNNAGLDVNIKEFDNSTDVTDDVINGKSDFGVGRSSLIYDRYQNKPVVMLGAIFQHSPVILLTKKRDDIRNVEDLKNKKIMLTSDQLAMASINAMLQSRQISSEMYTTQAHTFNVQDLIDGKTDVMLSYISNEPYAMKKQNIEYTVFSPKDYKFDFYSDILFTSESLLKKSPQVVKDFRIASLKGWNYAIENKEETVELILKKYNTQNKTKDALLFEADAIEKLISKDEVELGNIDSKRVEYITQIYSLMGLIKEHKSIEGLVYKVEKSDIELTDKEQEWINTHTVKIGVEQWKPVVFSNDGKDIDGIAGDFTKKIIKNTGLKVKVINDNWDTLLKDFKDKKIDLLPATYYTDTRADFGLYSDEYFKMKDALYLKDTTQNIKQLKDLEGKTLAIQKGYGTIDKLQKKFPKIKLVFTKDLDDSIDRVLSGRASAFYEGHIAAENKINDELIKGLKAIPIRDFKAPPLHYFSQVDEPILHSIIQKGLKSLSYKEKTEIISKWATSDVDIIFTDSEEKWLEKEQEISYVFDPSWKPLEWKDDLGSHTGIISDLLKLIELKSGLNFVEVPVESWDEAVEKIKNKEANMFSGLGETKERKKYVDFTDEYLFSTPYVFVSRQGEDYINGFSDIKNKRISVIHDSTIEGILKKTYPNTKLISFKTELKSFEKLQNNEIDVFIVNAATARYYINNLGYKDLKIAYKTEHNLELKIALSKKLPKEVLSIINKSVHAISESEVSNIFDKWTQVKVFQKVDYTLLYKVAAGAFIILLLFIVWNRKMAQEIDKRKEIEQQLQESSDRMSTLFDASPDSISIIDEKGNYVDCNQATLDIFGIASKKEFLQLKPHNLSPELQYNNIPSSEVALKEIGIAFEKGINKFEWQHQRVDTGELFDTEVVLSLVSLDHKPHIYGVVRDITKTKKAQKELKEIQEKQKLIIESKVNELTLKQTVQLKEIQKFQALTVGREGRMIELKELANDLSLQLNNQVLYDMHIDEDKLINTEEDERELEIDEIIDIPSLQGLLDNFCNSIEIASAIIDLKGNILASSRWQKACTHFHRVNESSCANCIQSDTDLSSKLEDGEEYSIYKCKNGLVDCASPIIINEKHIANVFIGQFLIQKPDILFFTEQSQRYGYNQSSYLEAIKEVPIIDEEKLPFILKFLSEFTKIITSLSMEKLKADKSDITNEKIKLAAINLAEDANLAKLEVEDLSKNLEQKVQSQTKDIREQKEFVTTLMDSQEQIIITTDGKILKNCNKAFLEFFAIEKIDDFIEVDDCICDRFEPDNTNTYLQKYMGEVSWIEYVLNNEDTIHKAVIKKDNTERIFTVTAATLPIGIGELKSAVFTDITEIEDIRKNIEMILSNIMLPVLITSKKDRKILYANEYASKQYELPIDELIGKCIDNVYTNVDQRAEILKILIRDGYVENLEERYKTQTGKEFTGLLSVKPIVYNFEESYIGMVVDITEQKEIEHEVKRLHKHTTDSIEYASLIQHALVPEQELFNKYFNDYFTIWNPKDLVGGDIYLCEELRNEEECLLMVIDCTGHGVPGAFVTMLVKAIERQVIAKIENDKTIEVSPAWILSYFNKTMKKLLKQENKDSISNAGFDGGIIYYNKKENILKFAGAETPLFYLEDDELKTIKGNRHSIGYKKSDVNYEFKDHIINVKDGMQFYITTDGYLDQNGGEKSFPFGKKKFMNIIEDNYNKSFLDQKERFIDTLKEYQNHEDRNDDVTVIGFKI